MREIVLRVFMDGYDKPVRQAFQPDPGNSTFSLCAGETPAPQQKQRQPALWCRLLACSGQAFQPGCCEKPGRQARKPDPRRQQTSKTNHRDTETTFRDRQACLQNKSNEGSRKSSRQMNPKGKSQLHWLKLLLHSLCLCGLLFGFVSAGSSGSRRRC